jgi:hypothetical protein
MAVFLSPFNGLVFYLPIKIRICFFNADKSKMVNFVPASASANMLRRNLSTNNNRQVADAGFIVNLYFLRWC